MNFENLGIFKCFTHALTMKNQGELQVLFFYELNELKNLIHQTETLSRIGTKIMKRRDKIPIYTPV